MIRSLPSLPGLSMSVSLEDRAPSPLPLPPLGHDISRPSSTSTQSSNALRHQHQHQQQQGQGHGSNNNIGGGVNLPGMSALASVASAQSPQMRCVDRPASPPASPPASGPSLRAIAGPQTRMPAEEITFADYDANRSFSSVNQGLNYAAASPTPTSVGGQGNSPPICQNCQTSTTPLWRRDELGSVLCNACGLFLKLHGRPRPISLKTDVIKSRNRVKSSGQAIKKAAKALLNGHGSRSEAGTPPPGLRRVSHKSSRGSDRSNSPISRATTPAIHHPSAIAPQHMFDTTHIAEPRHLTHSPSLPALHLRHPSPGSTISLGERHLEIPQTYDGLQQANTTLKTRVSELEVINGLFKGRVQELERAEHMQRQDLEQSRLREADLRRRLEDLEHHVTELRRDSPNYNSAKRRHDGDLPNPADISPPYSKRSRISDITQYPDPPSAPPSV